MERNLDLSSQDKKDLTLKEQKFVQHWLDLGNGTEAVRLAGYDVANDNVAANLAWRLLRKAKIQMTVKDELAALGTVCRIIDMENFENLLKVENGANQP